MKEIFENYVETSFDGNNQAEFKFVQFEKNYLKFFPENKKDEVLDIGIGRGEMLTCMKNWGYSNYLGIDISPSTISYCKEINLNCELVENTEVWLGKNSNKYSLITCLDVLEHVPRENIFIFLKSIRDALNENGIAIIQVPNLQSPFGYLHHFNDFTHVTGFVEHSFKQVLMTAGINKFQFYGFEEIFPESAKHILFLFLRFFYRKTIKFLRTINANPNGKILDPVMYAVIQKN